MNKDYKKVTVNRKNGTVKIDGKLHISFANQNPETRRVMAEQQAAWFVDHGESIHWVRYVWTNA